MNNIHWDGENVLFCIATDQKDFCLQKFTIIRCSKFEIVLQEEILYGVLSFSELRIDNYEGTTRSKTITTMRQFQDK